MVLNVFKLSENVCTVTGTGSRNTSTKKRIQCFANSGVFTVMKIQVMVFFTTQHHNPQHHDLNVVFCSVVMTI